MNINLTPEQERIVNAQLKSGRFRSAEEVIAQALIALRDKECVARSPGSANREEAVSEMLDFVEKNRTLLQGISVKQLIHEENPV